ncbi:MAG TPA: hypothetical protein VGJ11_02485 [Gaiellales bacterium]
MIAALAVLERICARLRGDVTVLYAARENLLLPCDLVHALRDDRRSRRP